MTDKLTYCRYAEMKSSLPCDSLAHLQYLSSPSTYACDSPRAGTPIPAPFSNIKSKQDKRVKDNKSKSLKKSSSKSNITTETVATKPHPPPLVRTSTPFPDPLKASVQPTIVRKRLKTRSISLEAVPVAPVIKPAPRPISINVYEHIRRNSDIPVPKDAPQIIREADKGSCLEFPLVSRKEHNSIASILADCEKTLRLIPLNHYI